LRKIEWQVYIYLPFPSLSTFGSSVKIGTIQIRLAGDLEIQIRLASRMMLTTPWHEMMKKKSMRVLKTT
jgi:hypothetical protein